MEIQKHVLQYFLHALHYFTLVPYISEVSNLRPKGQQKPRYFIRISKAVVRTEITMHTVAKSDQKVAKHYFQ